MSARVKLIFPEKSIFTTTIPVRISDINYGGHVGNDSILSIVHEARIQLFASWQMTEMDAGGVSLIMADAAIQFRGEAFYGDVLHIEISVGECTDIAFELYYKLHTLAKDIAWVKTGMVCFDYNERKKVSMSEALKAKLMG